jgi:hypothetical protein
MVISASFMKHDEAGIADMIKRVNQSVDSLFEYVFEETDDVNRVVTSYYRALGFPPEPLGRFITRQVYHRWKGKRRRILLLITALKEAGLLELTYNPELPQYTRPVES